MKILITAFLALAAAACSPPVEKSAAPPIDTRAVSAKPATALGELQLETPAAGARLVSPVHAAGVAPGTWYFEAVFPVKLIDETGTVLAEAPGQAAGDWMTEKPVHFTADLKFTVTTETKAWVVFAKDNPSGEPERDGEVRVPVTLLPSAKAP